jgi:Ras-related protein Rab-18
MVMSANGGEFNPLYLAFDDEQPERGWISVGSQGEEYTNINTKIKYDSLSNNILFTFAKTSLVNRFMGYEFDENYSCTISADFKIKSINIDPSTGAELTVWDTCGQEKFRAITRQYFKDAHGIVLVYDVENKNSFDGLSLWLNEIYSNTKADISIVLVANKIDILDRKISKEEGQEFASKNNLLYVETSSKEGINIDEPFEKLATNIIKKIRENPDYVYNETVEQKLKRIGERNAIERQREKEVKCC